MNLPSTIATACTSFLLTNLDDLLLLTTFFAESPSSPSLTPLTISLGQYLGFTTIIAISMLGYGLALVLPSEPIGFLGIVPILLGVWKIIELVVGVGDDEGGREDGMRVHREKAKASMVEYTKTVAKVSLITLTNGGDNVATYTPLFSQAQGAEIAVYIVVYYLFLGVWLLLAYAVMKERHVLRVVRRWARWVVPVLYLGMGIWIVVRSGCYPWAGGRIDEGVGGRPGKVILGVVTAMVVLGWVGGVVWVEVRGRRLADGGGDVEEGGGGMEEDGKVGERMGGKMEGKMDGKMEGKMDGKMEGKMGEQMGEQTDGKMEGDQTTDSTSAGKNE